MVGLGEHVYRLNVDQVITPPGKLADVTGERCRVAAHVDEERDCQPPQLSDHRVAEAGARRVYFASASPPVRFPNVYGIDMPVTGELVASGRTDAEVAGFIGADWLVYQDLDDLVRAVRYDNGDIAEFDTSCFSGHYVTGDVTPAYLARIESERCDAARAQREPVVDDSHDDDSAGVDEFPSRPRAGVA